MGPEDKKWDPLPHLTAFNTLAPPAEKCLKAVTPRPWRDGGGWAPGQGVTPLAVHPRGAVRGRKLPPSQSLTRGAVLLTL